MEQRADWFELEGYVDSSRGMHGVDVLFGTGRARQLADRFDRRGWQRPLIVCGSHVAGNTRLMDLARQALGARDVEVFDGTSPDKTLASVYAGVEHMRAVGADVLVGLGSGSSIDTARQMSVFGADGRPQSDFVDAARRGEQLRPRPTGGELPVVLLPTTLPGGAISTTGSIEVLSAGDSPTGQPVRTFGYITPDAVLHDPELLATTPRGSLCGSAMNGINKAIEAMYGRSATPLSDAYASQALHLISPNAAGMFAGDQASLGAVSAGVMLAQLRRNSSILHAFGHAIARRSPLQQGIIHAVMAPPGLHFLFSKVDGRRRPLAQALGIDVTGRSRDALAEAVVAEVSRIRDELGLPSSWDQVDVPVTFDDDAVAAYACDERLMDNAPLDEPMTLAEAKTLLAAVR